MSEGLRYELNPLNIKVKVVEPGMVKTNLYDSILEKRFEKYPLDYSGNFKKWHSYLLNNYRKGYSPDLDAKTIYKAVTTPNNKLRFSTDFNTKLVLLLHLVFPLTLFHNMVRNQLK